MASPSMTGMPRLQRWALRPLLLATLVLLALAASAASAQAGVVVTIQSPSGATTTPVSTEEIPGDITGTYRISTRTGGTETIRCEEAHCVSVIALLERSHANFDYATITIPRLNGRPLRLTREDVKHPDQPVFYTDDQGVTRFIGPPDDDRKVAFTNYFEVGSAVTLIQRRASKLKVRLTPREKKIEPGESVTFEASATGTEPDEEVVFSWGLKGSKLSPGDATHTHKFPKKDGDYKLLVSAAVEGSEDTVTEVAKITVGDPEESDKDREGGGTNSTGGADSGASDGADGDGSTYGGGSSGYTPSYTTPTPTPYTPTPAPPPSTPTPTPDPSPPNIVTDGSFVEGNLLADAGDPPSGSILESAARAARDGTPRNDESGGDIPEAALSLVGALALLGLGAGLESRQGRPLRLRLPRRAG